MDVVGRKVESQVQFWSLLGPFFVLLSIAVLLFKVSPHWYFPVSALIGIPLCVKWKMKGMAIALGSLLFLAGINFQDLELDDRYWHVGLSLAMAFSFIVLTLSLEEVQGMIGKLQLESQSRLDNFQLLDDKWKSAEQELLMEKDKAKGEVETLTQELARIQEDKQTFYKLAQLAKEELVQVREQHDQLLQDLLYKKQQIAQLHERLEESELTVQSFVNSDAEKQIQCLTERVACLEGEKETFKAKMAVAQEEGQACKIEKEHLWRELQASQEREKLSLIEHHRHQQDKQDQQQSFLSMQNKCTQLEQEKQTLLQTQTKLQQQYEHVRQLEAQQKHAVEQSHRKIHDLEVRLLEGEKQKEALQLRRKEMEEKLLYQEKQAKQKEEQYQANLKQVQNQLEEEKRRSESQLKQSQHLLLQQNQQEIKTLQERYHKVHEEFLKAKQDLESTQAALSQIRKKEEEYQASLAKLRSDLEASKKNASQQLESYQDKQNALIQELANLKERYQAVQQELVQAQREVEINKQNASQQLESYQDKQNALTQELINLKERHQAAQQELAQLKQEVEAGKKNESQQLQNYQEKQRALTQELADLKESYQSIQDGLDQATRNIEEKNETLAHMQKKMQQLSHDLGEQQSLFKQSAEQNQRLNNLKLKLEEELQQAQAELQQAKQKVEAKKHRPEKEVQPTAPGNTRRIESMYNQLKDQFQEKCRVLDETRRELFRANEELLRCRKEYEEDHLYDLSINEKHLQRHLTRLSKQFEQMQANYQQEVDDLTQLVGHLLHQMKK